MIVIGKITRQTFSRLQALNRYIQPVNLPLLDAQEIPTLRLKSEKYLLQNWWSESPFEIPPNTPMHVPVFSFLEGTYLNKQICMLAFTKNFHKISLINPSEETLSTGFTTSE